jgi:hypothetical protein
MNSLFALRLLVYQLPKTLLFVPLLLDQLVLVSWLIVKQL